MENFSSLSTENQKTVQTLSKLTKEYNASVVEEGVLSKEELKTRHVGKQDPKKHLESLGVQGMSRNIVQCLGSMLDAVSF